MISVILLDDDVRITLRRRNKIFVLWALVQIIVKSSIHGMEARKTSQGLAIELHVKANPKVDKTFVLALLIFKQD